jgi:hypothetical protein
MELIRLIAPPESILARILMRGTLLHSRYAPVARADRIEAAAAAARRARVDSIPKHELFSSTHERGLSALGTESVTGGKAGVQSSCRWFRQTRWTVRQR